MKKNTNTAYALGLMSIMALGFMMLSAPDNAEACCGAAAAISEQTSNDDVIKEAIVTEIRLTKDKLKDVLQDTGNRINSSIASSAQAEMEQKSQLFTEKASMASSAVCGGGTNSVVSKSATRGSAITAINNAAQANSSALSSALSKATTGTDKATKIARISVKSHDSTYCSDADVANGACPAAVTEKHQNADIKASNLFEPVYDPVQQKAAESFIARLAMPNSTQMISKNPNHDDVSYQDLRAKQLEVSAYNSIPITIFSDIQAERIPNKSSGNSLRDILGSTTDNPSTIQMMRGFANVEWAKYAATVSEGGKNSFYRVASLESMGFQNFVLVKQYEQLQKNGAAMAALLSLQLAGKKKALENAIESRN